MKLGTILKRLQAFIFIGIVILLCLKFTEASYLYETYFRHRGILRGSSGEVLHCGERLFYCEVKAVKSCHSQELLCDNTINCDDESDEKYCNIKDPAIDCPSDTLPWLMCSDNTRCYPRHFRCNGFINCKDGSDEMECNLEPISVPGAIEAGRNLTSILFKETLDHSTIKYGQHITHLILALSSIDRGLLTPASNDVGEIVHELPLQLFSKLALKNNNISTYELSQYINALLVTCIDPRDFSGIDLVAELRKRVNQSNYTNPFSILTLCNARDTMTIEDVHRLKNIFDAQRRPFWAATQSLATIAMACISSHSSLQIDEQIISDMVGVLKRKQDRDGTVENLRTTALVVQALLATGTYNTEFEMDSAVKMMINKVYSKDVNIQDIYYMLPVFNHMSLADVSSSHCEKLTKAEYVEVPFSVYVGDEMSLVRTWKFIVPATQNLYDVLEIVNKQEPGFKITYRTSNEKPYVIRVGNFTEDAEEGKFWFIYWRYVSGYLNKLFLVEKSPVDVPVEASVKLILWYKTAHWYTPFGTP